MIYEFGKGSGRLPLDGSLKEAISMAVWLRHQEIEINKIRVLAQGFADSATGNMKGTAEAFKAVLEGMFPFMGRTRDEQDQKLLDTMEKEVQKGPLLFSPIVMKPLKKSVQKLIVSDDFKQKLQDRVKRRE